MFRHVCMHVNDLAAWVVAFAAAVLQLSLMSCALKQVAFELREAGTLCSQQCGWLA